jgi:hypothetical protein
VRALRIHFRECRLRNQRNSEEPAVKALLQQDLPNKELCETAIHSDLQQIIRLGKVEPHKVAGPAYWQLVGKHPAAQDSTQTLVKWATRQMALQPIHFVSAIDSKWAQDQLGGTRFNIRWGTLFNVRKDLAEVGPAFEFRLAFAVFLMVRSGD